MWWSGRELNPQSKVLKSYLSARTRPPRGILYLIAIKKLLSFRVRGCFYSNVNFDIIGPMPRRGRRKKFRLKIKFYVRPDVVKSILAIAFVASGALSLLSFFAKDYFINEKINNFLRDVFGVGAIVVPIILLFSGLLFIDALKAKFKESRILVGLVGFLVSFSGLAWVFFAKGGLFGDKTVELLKKAISIYGAVLTLLAILAVSVLLVLDVSLNQMVSFFQKVIEKIKGLLPQKPDDGVIVTSGEEASVDMSAESHVGSAEEKKPKPELSFELMPSLSEPKGSEEGAKLVRQTGPLTSIAPTLPYADKVWETPPLDLLSEPVNAAPDAGNVKVRAKTIVDTLESFGINVEVVNIQPGPSVTQYSLKAESGTKISKIAALQYDMALALASPTGSVRIEAPIPGKSLIGVEVPNNNRVTVSFKSLLTSESMKAMKSKLGIVLGKDVGGNTAVYDVGKMPHLLVAGATGSGKSIFLHSAIFSILYNASPQECKFILVDPKRVELVHYAGIPHLLAPVITDNDKAAAVFKWAVIEMERRYKLFEQAKVRNIDVYNERSGFQALPYIMIIVDELADVMVADPAAVEKSIIRIAQMARATGIHLILSVQRPSTNIITGLIKANIPCRVAFNVSSQVDSRVIIDQPGAEKLLGKGDMLFVPPDAAKPTRLQGAFVSDREISNLVSYLKAQGVEPDYKDEVFEIPSNRDKSVAVGGDSVDDLFDEAVEAVTSAGKASASFLQRRLSIGYARAARILDELEEKGIVGPPKGSKPRDVLIDRPSEYPDGDFSDDADL